MSGYGLVSKYCRTSFLVLGALVLCRLPETLLAQSSTRPDIASESGRRLSANVDDVDALEATARAQAARSDFVDAIAGYRQVLALRPDDVAARIQLARLLAWNHQYGQSIRTYQSALALAPDDADALAGLAAVTEWSGQPAEAAALYAGLASAHPQSAEYVYQAARLEAALHQYPAARDRLATVLALNPEQLDARLLLAQLELKQGQYTSAVRQFERVLARRPDDPAALMGAAQARYYTGDVNAAYGEASKLVRQQPQNFDGIYLLASIEHARGHDAEARSLLRRAGRISAHNPEVAGLHERLRQQSPTVLHLSAGYAHETGTPGPSQNAESIAENLTNLSFGSQLDFVWLPRTTSSFSLGFFPTRSATETPGTVVPGQFLYRQTTRLASRLAVRAGFGLEDFGGVKLVNLRGYEQDSASPTPIGFAGASFSFTPRASGDFTWSRSGLPYTPLAAWLGVVSERTEAGFNFDLDRRSTLHITYFDDSLSTQTYWLAEAAYLPNGQSYETPYTVRDREHGSGGTLDFNHHLIEGERLALDAGFSAVVLGYNGPHSNIYIGVFTPPFYQRELVTSKLSGRISSRLGYGLATDLGAQQVDQGQPFKSAFTVSPSLDFRVTPYVSATLGYVYYNSSLALGVVHGTGVRLGIGWKF